MKLKYYLAIMLLLPAHNLIANEKTNNLAFTTCKENQTLKSSLNKLEDRGLQLIYSDALIRPWMQISKTIAKDLPTHTPAKSLNPLLAKFNLQLRAGAGGRWLIVKRKNKPILNTINGYIQDASSGEAIDNANIRIQGTEIETRTNSNGCFVLNGVPTNNAILNIDAKQFSPVSKSISIPKDRASTSTTIALLPTIQIQNIEEVTVTTSNYQFRLNQLVSGNKINQEDIKNFPRIANDINRTFRHLPGAAAGDISPRIHLRGGLVNETGITLDGVEFYDPFYFNSFEGLIGIVDSGMLSGADVISGGFTADQGRDMSGKINLISQKKFDYQHSIGASVFGVQAKTGGRYGEDNSWALSLRRGSWDYAFDSQLNSLLVNDNELNDSVINDSPFKDIFFRSHSQLNDNTDINIGLIYAKDNYQYQFERLLSLRDFPTEILLENKENENSQHAYLWLKAKTQWHENLSSTHIFSSSRRSRLNRTEDVFTLSDMKIKDEIFKATEIKSEWEYTITDDVLLRWGIHASYLKENEEYQQNLISIPLIEALTGSIDIKQSAQINKSGWDNGIYLTYRLRLFDKLITEAGLRWDQQTYVQNGNDNQISPRLNILFSANDQLSLRLAWGTFYQAQGIDELTIERDVVEFYPAQRNEQTILGAEYMPHKNIRLSAELYYKYYSDVSPRFESLLDPGAGYQRFESVRIEPESAQAYGSEWSVRYDTANIFAGSLSYTYSEATDTINDKKVNRSWNQRHAIHVDMGWQFHQTYFTLAWLYRSGWPSTEVFGYDIIFDENQQPQLEAITGERNAIRSGSYKRLDLRLSQDINIMKSKLTLYVELINALDDQNPCCNDRIAIDENGQLSSGGFSLWLNRAVAFGMTLDF